MLTVAQAYEAAYRFVSQYAGRSPDSEELLLMLVAMQPVKDHYRTNDPAHWDDWLECVEETRTSAPMPTPYADG
jgi:hypothetical protein